MADSVKVTAPRGVTGNLLSSHSSQEGEAADAPFGHELVRLAERLGHAGLTNALGGELTAHTAPKDVATGPGRHGRSNTQPG